MAKTYRKNRLEVIALVEEFEQDYIQFLAESINNFWLGVIGPRTERRFKFGLNPFKWWQDVPVQSESEAFYELFDSMYEIDDDITDLLKRAKASKAKTITLTEDEYVFLYEDVNDWEDELTDLPN